MPYYRAMLKFQSFHQRGHDSDKPSPLEPGDDSLFNSLATTNGKVDSKKLPSARSILGDQKVDYILAQLEQERLAAEKSSAAAEKKLPPDAKGKKGAEDSEAKLPALSKSQVAAAKKSAESTPTPATKATPAAAPPPLMKKKSLSEKLAAMGIDPEKVRGMCNAPAAPAPRVAPLPPEIASAPAAVKPKHVAAPAPAPRKVEVLPRPKPAVPEWLKARIENELPPRTALMTADANHASAVMLISKTVEQALAAHAPDQDLSNFNASVRTVAFNLNRIAAALSEQKPNVERVAELVQDIESRLRSPEHTRAVISDFLDLIRDGKIGWSGAAQSKNT